MILSKKEMCDILRSVRCIGPNNAGVTEATQLLAEAMREAENAKCTDCVYKQESDLIKDSGAIIMFP